jgi:hypothetical protein
MAVFGFWYHRLLVAYYSLTHFTVPSELTPYALLGNLVPWSMAGVEWGCYDVD